MGQQSWDSIPNAPKAIEPPKLDWDTIPSSPVNPPGNTSPAASVPSVTSPKMPNAQDMVLSGAHKAWDWGNKSIFNVEDPTPEEIQHEGMPAVIRKGVAGLTTPLSLLGEAAGGLGLIKGAKYLKGASKTAEVAEELPKVKSPINAITETAEELPKPKIKLVTNRDGSLSPKDNPLMRLDPATLKPVGPKKVKLSNLEASLDTSMTPFTGKVDDASLPPDPSFHGYTVTIPNMKLRGQVVGDLDKAAESDPALYDLVNNRRGSQEYKDLVNSKYDELKAQYKEKNLDLPDDHDDGIIHVASELNPRKINMNTGEGASDLKHPDIEASWDHIPDDKMSATLPKDLMGAKPRYNIGGTSYTPKFESDVDKAAYITAQTNPSKRDADYLKFVMDATGLDEKGARDLGKQIKNHVSGNIKAHHTIGGPEGEVTIPKYDGYLNQNSLESPGNNSLKISDHRGTGSMELDHTDVPGYLSVEGVVATPTKKGIGTDLYIKALEEAKNRGLKGVASVVDNRSPEGNLIWDKLKKMGKVTTITDSNGRTIDTLSELNPKVNINSGTMPNVKGPEVDMQVSAGGGKPPKPPKEYALEDDNFDWKEWNKKPIKDKIVDALGSSRSIQSIDFTSAPLRQGFGLIHKKSFWTSIKPSFEAMGSEKNYREIAQSVIDHPRFKDAMEHGVSFTGFKDIASREEQFQSPLAEHVIPAVVDWAKNKGLSPTIADKIPNPIRSAARGYTTFMNKLRMDSYSSLVENAEKINKVAKSQGLPEAPINKPAISKFINTATGRGVFNSKMIEQAMPLANQVIYSPRLMKAHLDMLNPYTYIRQSNKSVRLEYLKSAAAITAAAGTTNLLLGLVGGKNNEDMNSSDFGKIKFGDTRLDPMGGNQQYIVLMHRLASNHTTNGNGKQEKLDSRFGGPTKLGALGNFIRNKLAPVPAAVINTVAGKDGGGNPTNTSISNNEAVKLFTPMIVQDFADLMKSDPKLLPLLLPANLGMSLQTYTTPKPKAKGFSIPKVKF